MATKKLQILESLVATDNTLTQENKPADANAVGEAIGMIEKLVPSYASKHTAPNDLLNVYLNCDYTQDCMQPSQVATEDASTLVNSPLASGAFYAVRTVEGYGVGHVCVRLHEMYPSNGRVWSNMYDKNQQNWMGWVSNVGGGSVDLSAYATKSELNAHYISTITTGSADNILIPLTLRDIRTDNDELRSIISGNGTQNENYAYITTTFLNSASAGASKVQTAIGYTYGYTATRAYYANTGWKPWNMSLTTILNEYSYGTTLPTAGTKGRIFFKKA